MHTVERVEGMRYSFTREIYFKEGHSIKKLTEKDKMEILLQHRMKAQSQA